MVGIPRRLMGFPSDVFGGAFEFFGSYPAPSYST